MNHRHMSRAEFAALLIAALSGEESGADRIDSAEQIDDTTIGVETRNGARFVLDVEALDEPHDDQIAEAIREHVTEVDRYWTTGPGRDVLARDAQIIAGRAVQ